MRRTRNTSSIPEQDTTRNDNSNYNRTIFRFVNVILCVLVLAILRLYREALFYQSPKTNKSIQTVDIVDIDTAHKAAEINVNASEHGQNSSSQTNVPFHIADISDIDTAHKAAEIETNANERGQSSSSQMNISIKSADINDINTAHKAAERKINRYQLKQNTATCFEWKKTIFENITVELNILDAEERFDRTYGVLKGKGGAYSENNTTIPPLGADSASWSYPASVILIYIYYTIKISDI
jgi:hypothetical protein